MSDSGFRLAVEGCGHGTLHAIYASVEKTCQVRGWDGVDLLIIGGDFQAVRNTYDLNGMSVPMKFRKIGDFHEYYSGQRQAPYLTIFVGGNHEASNYLFELYYGGWVAPNIYYLGAANVIRCGPLRIAGLSGIWKGYNYRKPHYERLPYSQDDLKSIYHVRELDVRKLLQLKTQVDVAVSHDWPQGIEWLGNWKRLFSRKSFFEEDARNGTLGSVAAKALLNHLKPLHWFSAHLHCKYTAIVTFANSATNNDARRSQSVPVLEDAHNDEEIELDLDGLDEPEMEHHHNTSSSLQGEAQTDAHAKSANAEQSQSDISEALRNQLPAAFRKPMETVSSVPNQITNTSTNFVALDKCLPNRHFLQLLELDPVDKPTSIAEQRPFSLFYDVEWLAITRVFANELEVGNPAGSVPKHRGDGQYQNLVELEKRWIEENVVQRQGLAVSADFVHTAPVFDTKVDMKTLEQPKEWTNPQTSAFCRMLQIPNPFDISEEERASRTVTAPRGDVFPRRRGGGTQRGPHRGRSRPRGR